MGQFGVLPAELNKDVDGEALIGAADLVDIQNTHTNVYRLRRLLVISQCTHRAHPGDKKQGDS